MRKHLLVFGFAALFAAFLASPAAASQDNANGLGASEGAEGTIFKSICAGSGCAAATNGNYFAAHYACSDPTLTSTVLSAAVADCCIAGDTWHVTLYKGSKAALIASTANVASSTPGAGAFAPDVYSPNASLVTAVKKIQAVATIGNSAPGGLPAGATLRFITNGGGPVCSRIQVTNGTADP